MRLPEPGKGSWRHTGRWSTKPDIFELRRRKEFYYQCLQKIVDLLDAAYILEYTDPEWIATLAWDFAFACRWPERLSVDSQRPVPQLVLE